ncbi:DUF317 domain-containing protein [Streptomyces sp. NPDC018352]|uniref:DUF317 domain-containing protein n=1 Tax=Streptomyces sp. NPDC018352 TaxID=3157194 RepID=UPI0033CBA596
MPVSERQLAAFIDKHAGQIPVDTSPRHLAGPGDARHVTHGLAAAGWAPTSDLLSPEIILRSPDHRLALHLDPQSPTSWWHLQANTTDTEPGWYAAFGERIPAEILSSFTDALVGPQSIRRPPPFEVLEAAGWAVDSSTAHSADGMCHVEQQTAQSVGGAHWRVTTCRPGYGTPMGPRIWDAWFSADTPEHLVSAFVSGLTQAGPLQRGMYEPTAHHSVVQNPSPLTPAQVVEAHRARLATLRARARRARLQQPKPATAPPKTGIARPTATR